MDLNYHVTEDQLEQYALGRTGEAELESVEEHLLICTACQERLDEAEVFTLAMREALNESPASTTKIVESSSPVRAWFAWMKRPVFVMAAAAAALVITAGIYSTGKTGLAPVATLQLTAARSGEVPEVRAARETDLTLAGVAADAAPLQAEVVDASGRTMWKGRTQTSGGGAEVKVTTGLKPGEYFLRVSSTDGQSEYGFRVR